MSRFACQASEVALHSPPQFNRRLPTKEPRPQQVKSMTIAAGFRCLDGVLLVADSKHNIGDASYSGPKIWEVECGESGSSIIVTGAGVDSAISDAVDYLRDDAAINGDSVSFEIVESAIKGSGFGKETTLLLGIKIRSENRGRLFRVEEGDQGIVRVSSVESSTFTGTPRAGADSRLLESAPATKRGIRFHPEGAACRGEAPPRPYVLVVYPHVIDGLAALPPCLAERLCLSEPSRSSFRVFGEAAPRRLRHSLNLAGSGKTPQAVIPSGARNLARSVFKAMRDSSSPAAPRNDSPPGFFRSLQGTSSEAQPGKAKPFRKTGRRSRWAPAVVAHSI